MKNLAAVNRHCEICHMGYFNNFIYISIKFTLLPLITIKTHTSYNIFNHPYR